MTTNNPPRRDPAAAVLGGGIAAILGAVAAYMTSLGGLWPIAAAAPALLALVGLYGLTQSLQRRDRGTHTTGRNR